ncbi:MAG TPA: hypothetical protein DCL61_31765 [Cyanobacteria bacterium UBA12227]|nr:hypothetical protein [Cyanobacteria bacterium UBA12227]HAX89287.1 hypothetical protein [Cyanobacteria bacterium UBA11370]HBY78586.1 hypothetical protein [Cyanobacteria bacterium UBA11148]
MTNKTFRVSGRVIEQATRQGVAGLRVEAWDKDLIIDDLLGSAVTEADGTFHLSFDESYFRELFLDRRPDLYFNIYNQNELIKSTENSVRWNVEEQESEVVVELETVPPLVLKEGDLRGNMISLFEDLQSDERLREAFIQNPTKLITTKIVKKQLPPQKESETNRLLFSLLANERVLEWLDNYNQSSADNPVNKKQFAQDFAKAITELDDGNITLSLIRNAALGYGIPGLTDVAEQLIINNAAGQAVATPVAQPSTSDQSTRSSQNFNGIGFGNLGQIDPSFIRATIEQLISYAEELKQVGRLADLNSQIR